VNIVKKKSEQWEEVYPRKGKRKPPFIFHLGRPMAARREKDEGGSGKRGSEGCEEKSIDIRGRRTRDRCFKRGRGDLFLPSRSGHSQTKKTEERVKDQGMDGGKKEGCQRGFGRKIESGENLSPPPPLKKGYEQSGAKQIRMIS